MAQWARDNRLIESIIAASDHLAILPRFTTRTENDLVLRPITSVAAVRHMSAVMRPDRAQRKSVKTLLASIIRTTDDALGFIS